ncbi:MAG: hypothetical protein LC781_04305 [Actinobacteria bacterium]|nr:hypothetical protein [Actinomycetota bacterium]
MTSTVRNRLLALGVLWGLLLAAVPALYMTSPYRLTGLLVVGLASAALSGCVGTLVAGRRAAKKGGGRPGLLAGVGAGTLQGLAGGVVAALLIWALMAVSISDFTLRNPVELSVLMSPTVFIGSFFVALSAFAYALVGGVLLGPIFGTLVNRTVRAGKNAAGEKEDLVVR